MAVDAPLRKLVKLRTYQDDLARVRPQHKEASAPAQQPAQTQTVSVSEPVTPKKPTIPTRTTIEKKETPTFKLPDTQHTTTTPPSPKPTPPPLTKNPAHHETDRTETPIPRRAASPFVAEDLKKITTERRASLLASDPNTFDVPHAHTVGEGTIVTDTRRDGFKLLPAIIQAVKSWLFVQKEAFEERQKPKFTVVPAEQRKDTVTRAATDAALAPKDDHAQVASRLRHVPRVKTVKDLSIKEAAAIPKPTWSHVQDSVQPKHSEKPSLVQPTPIVDAPTDESENTKEFSLLFKPTPPPPVPQQPAVKLQTKPDPIPRDTKPVPPPRPPVPQKPKPVLKTPPSQQTQRPVIPTPVVSHAARPTQPQVKQSHAPVAPQEPREPVVSQAKTVPSQKTKPRPLPARAPSRLYPIIAVSVLATVLGTAAAFLIFSDNDTVRIPTTVTQSFMNADATRDVALSTSRNELLANLANAVNDAGQTTITQFSLTTTQSGDLEPATTADVMAVLDPRAPGSFVRAVTDIGFGSYRGSEPFIMLKVTSYDVALGGMLLWEESMSTDLAPLFGNAVRGTFDPAAQNATQTREPHFVDIVHANRDMRVLRDEQDDERIIYSFLDRTTILISTDRTVIEDVAPLIH